MDPKRYIYTAAGAITLIMVGFGIVYFIFSPEEQQPTQNPQQVTTPNTSYTVPLTTTQTEVRDQVRSAFQKQVADGHFDNIKLKQTVVYRDWALQTWVGDVMGGEALMKYEEASGEWRVLDIGGGAWSADALVRLGGVPEDVAPKLIEGRPY